jgi:hypothetical protein
MDNSTSSLFVAISQKLQLKQHFTLLRNLRQLHLWAPVNSELMVELVNIFFCCTYFGEFKESYILPTWVCLYSLLQGFRQKKWCIFFFQWPLSLHHKHPQKLITTVFPCAFLACGNGYFLIFLTICLKQHNAHLQTPQKFLSHSLPLLLPLLQKTGLSCRPTGSHDPKQLNFRLRAHMVLIIKRIATQNLSWCQLLQR